MDWRTDTGLLEESQEALRKKDPAKYGQCTAIA